MATTTIYDPPRPRDIASKERRIAQRLTKAMPGDVKAYYVEKYKANAEDAFKRLLTGSDHICPKCDCSRPNHHAVRMFLEMAGAVGASQTIVIGVLQKFGVKDEGEMQALLESGRKMERMGQDIDARRLFEDGLEAVRLACNSDPSWKAEAIQRLGSVAVESTNGDEPYVPST